MPQVLAARWLLRAFNELSTCRQLGMTIGPIPVTAIFDYVDRYAMPEWTVDALMKIDAEWLELVRAQSEHD